jgi:hypothetical protein
MVIHSRCNQTQTEGIAVNALTRELARVFEHTKPGWKAVIVFAQPCDPGVTSRSIARQPVTQDSRARLARSF